MKKVFYLLSVCFVAVLLVGCSKNTKSTYEIKLESNETTGYSWQYSMSEDGIVEMTKDEYIESNNQEEMVGVGGTQLYEITALKEGEVTITFLYRQPWDESETANVSGYIYKFKVDSDLSIELISKEDWPTE